MKVFVDGREIELLPDARLADALREAGASPAQGAIVGVVKGRGEKSRQTNSYWLNATKGKLRIELLENELQRIWHENVAKIQGSRLDGPRQTRLPSGHSHPISLSAGMPMSTTGGKLFWEQPGLMRKTLSSSSCRGGIRQPMVRQAMAVCSPTL